MRAIKFLTVFLNRIVESGTQQHKGARHNQITRFINIFGLFGILIILFHLMLTLYFRAYVASLFQFVTVILIALVMYSNSRHYFNFSRVSSILIGNFHILGIVLLLGLDMGVHNYFSFAIMMPLFFYTREEKKYIFGFSLMSIMLAILVHISSIKFKPIIQAPEALMAVLFYLSVSGALIVIFVFVYFFYKESYRFEQSMEKANAKLHRLSETDHLTQLPNRRNFDKNLKREWGRGERNNTPCSLMMMDIDYFKRFNTVYGHQAGDVCLERVAEIIKVNIREFLDFPARYGGEEFIILLSDTILKDACKIAERIRSEILSLAILHEQNEHHGVVTCSFGVACDIPGHGLTHQQLINQADKALYQAKEKGRNKIEYI